jgi:glycosyltransferase involved in cell wall biosynthesis
MKLSVSVVTYQQVAYVRQAVESVLRQQTRFPFEVIVGDDASTDGTREILEDIRAGSPDQVKLLLAESNYGDYGLSNVMATIDAARGEYIAFLDGDDYWTAPHKLQKQVEFMDGHPECAICAHRVAHLSADGDRSLSVRPGVGDSLYNVDQLLDVNFTPKSATVVRRSAVETLPQWCRTTDVASAAWLFNVLMARRGKVGFIDEVMAVHRIHSDSVTFLYGTERMLADKLAAFEMLRPYLPQQEAALVRAERRIRMKLRMVGLSPRAYLLLQRLYNLVTSRRL